MSENVAIEKSRNAIAVWDDLKSVREQFAPTLTDREFAFFVTLGKSFNANPFKREIWAVKYDKSAPASIFLGRDMYRRKAQETAEYDGHIADAVYSGDRFSVENGIPKHSYSLADRGCLLGAYCVVYKKNQTHPFFVFVKLSEYDKGFALWKTMKETLIKKVAEAQGLRGAFQGVFAGTYDESEQWEIMPTSKANVIPPPALEAKHEPQVEPEPKHEPVGPRPSEMSEPPDDQPLASDGARELDDYGRLDDMVRDRAKGNTEHMEQIYDTITGFYDSNKQWRSCKNMESLRKWKPGAVHKALRNMEQRIGMGTKFKFEQPKEDEE